MLSILCLFVIVSCKGPQDLAGGKPIHGKSPQYLTKKLKANQFKEFDTMSAKISTKATFQGKTYNFKSNLRMRRDSAIWIMMSPAMGIEAGRVLITKDSLKFMDKLNKKYWIGSFTDARKVLKADLDYDMLQDFILGNAVGFDFEGKYKSSVDSSNTWLLTSKNPKKVRKAVEFQKDKKHFETDTTLNISVNDKKLEKALEKVEDEELLILRYWMSPENFKPVKVMINDLANPGVIEINYQEHELVEERWFPKFTRLYISDLKDAAEIEMKYGKIKMNKNLSYPFRITDKYEEIVY